MQPNFAFWNQNRPIAERVPITKNQEVRGTRSTHRFP
jgi:hypothetical protein